MMIKRNLWLSSILISTLLFACGNGNAEEQQNNESKGILSGKLEGLSTSQLFLIDLLNPKRGPVDTAYVSEEGEFNFDYQPQAIGFYRLNLNEIIAVILPLESGDQVSLSGNPNTAKGIEVSGSENAERMTEFNHFLQEINDSQNQLNADFQQYANSPKRDSIMKSFRAEYQDLEDKKAAKVRELVNEKPGLFANIALMEQLPSSGKENIEAYKKVDAALSERYGNSPFYQSFKSRMQDAIKFAPGSSVPEINLPNPEGELIPLSSLRGKVVLIDFWASWCKPCRRENPNVVAAYQKYKDKGFTVYGVSLDRTKEAWVRAIEQDNLTWTQVSDLKFWQSEAAKAYGVRGIPFALLIDEEGKVIGKNLRGPALQQKLAEVLN